MLIDIDRVIIYVVASAIVKTFASVLAQLLGYSNVTVSVVRPRLDVVNTCILCIWNAFIDSLHNLLRILRKHIFSFF